MTRCWHFVAWLTCQWGPGGTEGWRIRGQERLRKIPPHDLPGSGPNHRYLIGLRQAVASCGGLWGGGWGGLWRPLAPVGRLCRPLAGDCSPYNTFTSKDGVLEVLKSSMQRDLSGLGGLEGFGGLGGFEGLEDYEGRMD